jgi:hypothetical protein
VDPLGERVEVEHATARHHQLAVDDAPIGQLLAERRCSSGK